MPQARKDAAVNMISNGHSYREACAATGLSRSTILRAVQVASHILSSGGFIPQNTEKKTFWGIEPGFWGLLMRNKKNMSKDGLFLVMAFR